MKKVWILTLYFHFFFSICANCQEQPTPRNEKGRIEIIIRNIANGQPILLDSSINKNPFEEDYTLTKLKYYISHLSFYLADKKAYENKDCFLVDQSIDSSLHISFIIPPGSYQRICFLIGVDSLLNTSGAQTGVLDPLNNMFWTWNSGYIMFKIEGRSPQSTAVNDKIEYHIGGFNGENSVLRDITIPFPGNSTLTIKNDETTLIFIDADLDKFWNGDKSLKIIETPVCTSPGVLAKEISGNFSRIFSVSNIIQND